MKLRTTTLAAGFAALAVAVVAVSCTVVTGGTAARQHSTVWVTATATGPTSALATPPPPSTVSAEDQIRQTVIAFQDAYSTQNWDARTVKIMSSIESTPWTFPSAPASTKRR
jgi:hypothetical protein